MPEHPGKVEEPRQDTPVEDTPDHDHDDDGGSVMVGDQPTEQMRRLWTHMVTSMSRQIADGRGEALPAPGVPLTELLGQADLVDPVTELQQPDGTRERVAPDDGLHPADRKFTTNLAWGGFQNGRIPLEAMTQVAPGQYLEPGAATAFLSMVEAAKRDGVTIKLTDSYRSYDAQVSVRKRKGHKVATATPGTSKHGWGRAIDVAGDAARTWIQQNGAQFGWIWPDWAQRKGTKSYEPWHFEHYGGGGTQQPAQVAEGPAPGEMERAQRSTGPSQRTVTPTDAPAASGRQSRGGVVV